MLGTTLGQFLFGLVIVAGVGYFVYLLGKTEALKAYLVLAGISMIPVVGIIISIIAGAYILYEKSQSRLRKIGAGFFFLALFMTFIIQHAIIFIRI